MTIESKLDALTTAITLLTKQLSEIIESTAYTSGGLDVPSMIKVLDTPSITASPVAAPELVPVIAPAAPAPEMPAPPVYEVVSALVVQEPSKKAAPVTDAKGLTDYVIGVYTSLGPDKGAGIQTVIVSLGYENINDIKPEHYDALFAGVEALKG